MTTRGSDERRLFVNVNKKKKSNQKHCRVKEILKSLVPSAVLFAIAVLPKGEHGYDNQALDMKPFFPALGPDLQKDLEVGPFETVNIYPLMCHLLEISPETNDCSLDITRRMLTSSAQPEGKNSSDTLTSVITGLGALAGFLVIVFVVLFSYGIHKHSKNKNG
ncbi:Ectonucleotide pyrophosphatase/phosphodiesterase family member 7 [Triplophysa tibetana]|uniref:Ectonucleotide pyrophosphatase/phosphodiesterase family member 7 n=1 Tax=Triplophysa tibetana TaxID=1572043 RepID=A0A5A9N8D4_9TELE|nr:Ectonucleotide pyrophosphatase/phosphodiesterase family member 7 [Triplophysa tibetana]